VIGMEVGRMVRPHFAIHANDDPVEATELRHSYSVRAAPSNASLVPPHAGNQRLATKGLSTPQEVRARLLHRLARPLWPRHSSMADLVDGRTFTSATRYEAQQAFDAAPTATRHCEAMLSRRTTIVPRRSDTPFFRRAGDRSTTASR
jgi:hypothetical protein